MPDRDPTSPDYWSSDRMETAYDEARAVLDAQQQTIADVDDKATRAVRITVLLLGGLISVWRFAGSAFDAWLALWGGISLFLSLAFGVATFHESDLVLGPTEEYLDDLNYDPEGFQDGWKSDVVDTYGGFIEANPEDVTFNGTSSSASRCSSSKVYSCSDSRSFCSGAIRTNPTPSLRSSLLHPNRIGWPSTLSVAVQGAQTPPSRSDRAERGSE